MTEINGSHWLDGVRDLWHRHSTETAQIPSDTNTIVHVAYKPTILTMSLSGMHSPHVSMSSDFSSSLGLAEMLGEFEAQERAALQRSPRIDEHTPLMMNGNGHQKQQEELS